MKHQFDDRSLFIILHLLGFSPRTYEICRGKRNPEKGRRWSATDGCNHNFQPGLRSNYKSHPFATSKPQFLPTKQGTILFPK